MYSAPYLPEPDPIVAELLPDYLANRREELPRLRQYLVAHDFTALRRAGHDLKGTGAGYGLPPVSDYGAALEQAAAADDAGAARQVIDALATFLDRVQLPRVG